MEGLYIRNKYVHRTEAGDSPLSLLAKHGKLQIMTQEIGKGAVVWISPGEDQETFEFFFIHSGKLEIHDEGNTEVLSAGDWFYAERLKADIQLRCICDSKLLYVSNSPVFDEEAYWQNRLSHLIDRIDSKDHYTKGHSMSVAHYAVKLRGALADHCNWLTTEEFTLAALFHDVGKCNIPDHILLKPGRLTEEEYEQIKKHPLESAKILEPLFGKKVAVLACMHHERVDGSGYPQGLEGDEIPMEARILSVADAFDAMTTRRVYSDARSLRVAAEEISNLPRQYDKLVTEALVKLVEQGELDEINREALENM